MIIERVEAIHLRVPFKPGNKSAAAAWGGKDQAAAEPLMVKVTTHEGLVGWGETLASVSFPLCQDRD